MVQLPAIKKIWQFNVNQQIIYDFFGDTVAKVMYAISSSLVSFSQSPWIVSGSSNTTAFGMDGVNRWTSHSAILDGAWIVLNQPGIGPNFYLTMHKVNTSDIRMFASHGLPTGGTATTPPTHSTTYNINANVASGVYINYMDLMYLHVMQSSDGECTRVILTPGHATPVNMSLIIDKICGAKSYWTTPVVTYYDGNFGSGTVLAATSMINSGYLTTSFGSLGKRRLAWTTLGQGGDQILNRTAWGQYGNALDDSYLIAQMGVVGTNYDILGYHGDVTDIWALPIALGGNGFVFPSDGSKKYCSFGNFLFPWNGTTPVIQ